MILFLNFAPYTFMGGAEKLLLELAQEVNKKEEVVLIDVSPKIANIYGQLVLKRSFRSHLDDHNIKLFNNYSLTILSFIPFTKDWTKTVNYFKKSRIIYMRFELLEIAICIYFGGMKGLKKTIAGLHLTPFYASPRGLVDRLHNYIYGSVLYKFFLKTVSKVHVLNLRDKKLLESVYSIKTVKMLPAGIHYGNVKLDNHNINKNLNIIFVGELSTRKGVDTLCKIISLSPSNLAFHIVGDGPMKKNIISLADDKKCIYHGYVSDKKLSNLYKQSDVLVFPSRAEAFGIVMAEAMGYGLKIVNSSEVTLQLPNYIESTISDRNENKYILTLEKIFQAKQKKQIDKAKIQQFALKNYSSENINRRFSKEIIGV